MKYAELTAAQKRARNKSNEPSKARYRAATYDNIGLRIRKDGGDGITADQIRHAAESAGQSINAWVLDAIRDKL